MPSSLPSATLPFTPKSQSLFKTNQIKNSRNARTTITINNTNSGTVGRRQTNPMPAPKAVRTQSLPIWNLKPNIANTGFPRNSIAHKIYLADRKTEANQQNNQHQNIAYEINTLQNDNTIQRTKIDDSVSKRFDFMLNKRKSTKKVSPGIEGQKLQQKQKGRKISLTSENDKENIPPQSITSKENKLEGDLDFNAEFPMSDFSDVVFKDEMGWFSNFNCNFFESPTSASASQLNQQNLKPSITLNDPNTCNTIALENEDVSELETAQNNKISLPSDVDKTSPIDSLSIPLIELTHSSSTTNMQRISIKEGSTLNITDSNNATPCDNDIKGRKASVIDSDNTKPQAGLINFSTPADQPASDNNVTASKKLTSMLETQQSKRSHEEVLDEEEEEEALKKQKAIPSSPCGMFNYHQPMELSEDIVEEEQGHNIGDDNESDKTNDLFSTFVHSGRRVSQVVTSPIGEFQSIKH
ncbi:ANL_collapsed_G0042770.mRNA.1.CDS.1 [Saccharomyces cerevisiae]|nr:ANL_collapsed_G0042770.mRNA.1.CDS.1 [Saccharomyces cerevisiae]